MTVTEAETKLVMLHSLVSENGSEELYGSLIDFLDRIEFEISKCRVCNGKQYLIYSNPSLGNGYIERHRVHSNTCMYEYPCPKCNANGTLMNHLVSCGSCGIEYEFEAFEMDSQDSLCLKCKESFESKNSLVPVVRPVRTGRWQPKLGRGKEVQKEQVKKQKKK